MPLVAVHEPVHEPEQTRYSPSRFGSALFPDMTEPRGNGMALAAWSHCSVLQSQEVSHRDPWRWMQRSDCHFLLLGKTLVLRFRHP